MTHFQCTRINKNCNLRVSTIGRGSQINTKPLPKWSKHHRTYPKQARTQNQTHLRPWLPLVQCSVYFGAVLRNLETIPNRCTEQAASRHDAMTQPLGVTPSAAQPAILCALVPYRDSCQRMTQTERRKQQQSELATAVPQGSWRCAKFFVVHEYGWRTWEKDDSASCGELTNWAVMMWTRPNIVQ